MARLLLWECEMALLSQEAALLALAAREWARECAPPATPPTR